MNNQYLKFFLENEDHQMGSWFQCKNQSCTTPLGKGIYSLDDFTDWGGKCMTCGEKLGFFTHRGHAVKKWAWAIPTEAAIREMVKYTPLIEIGAGSGYWAKLVEEEGGQVLCFDQYEPIQNKNYTFIRQYHDVSLGGPEVLPDFPRHTLFLCWPPYHSSLASDCLKKYPGKTLIFVGEGWGGCTGDDEFFEILEKDWEQKEIDIQIPQWWGMHDYFNIYRRIK